MRFVLGNRVDKQGGGSHGALSSDLAVLLETRMLIQATSGGGKTRTIRRILEQTHGKVQHIVIDPEGEFATLRERFDYVLVGPGGEATPHPRTAALLAERLLELGASAVIDLFELKRGGQHREFVKRFLMALVDIPKSLYHPVIVVLDEAHEFCPEKGGAVSRQAVIDAASLGRKRGQCLICATQRISKFAKDAAAELKNRMIGGTTLDVDVKRAGDELGFDKEGMRALRDLEPGQFWTYGPATIKVPTLIQVGDVVTSHPKPGAKLTAPTPPPTAKIKALLPKLADLPKEQEQRERTVADLERELAVVRHRNRQLEMTGPLPPRIVEKTKTETKVVKVLVPMLKRSQTADLRRAALAVDHAVGLLAAATQRATNLPVLGADLHRTLQDIRKTLTDATALAAKVPATPVPRQLPGVDLAAPGRRDVTVTRVVPEVDADARLTPVAQRILNALADLEELRVPAPTRPIVAFLAGYEHIRSKGYMNSLSGLKTAGAIEYQPGGRLALTVAGRHQAVARPAPETVDELQDRLYALLGGATARVLKPLVSAHPDALGRQELAEVAGYQHVRSKGFMNAISRLRTLGFVRDDGPGRLKATPLLFLQGDA